MEIAMIFKPMTKPFVKPQARLIAKVELLTDHYSCSICLVGGIDHQHGQPKNEKKS